MTEPNDIAPPVGSTDDTGVFSNALQFFKDTMAKAFSFSSETEPEAAFKDGAKKLQRQYQRQGLYSTGGGMIAPLPEPVNGKELKDTLNGMWNSLTGQHGPAALDGKDTPIAAAYGERRMDFMSREEGVRKFSYKDNVGIPTVGIGFNLKANKKLFKEALGVEDAFYKDVVAGKKSLNDEQVRTLFDNTIAVAEDVIKRKISPDHPITENQRMALVSLAFNGGGGIIGPKITKALKTGDWQGVVDEILWDSGSKKNAALRGRRWREAQMFAGTDHKLKIPSMKAYKKWQKS